MLTASITRRYTLCGYALLMGGIVLVDLRTPLAINIPILLLIPLLLAFLLESLAVAAVLASAATILAVIHPLVQREGWLVVGMINRGLDIGVFWVAFAMSARDKRLAAARRRIEAQLARTEQAAQEQERRAKRALEDMKYALDAASIVAVTDARGVIQYVNNRFCETSRYRSDELIGQNHRIVNSGFHTVAFMRELWQRIATGRVWHGEMRNRAKDGSLYWVDTTIVPFLDEEGRPYQYMAIHNDITERKLAETRLLRQAALARVGDMAAIVAHEVRNPVTGLRGALNLFERQLSLPPPEQQVMRQMIERLDQLSARVNDLLRFSLPRTPTLRAVALRPLLERCINDTFPTSAAADTHCELSGEDFIVQGDEHLLEEVFSNLLKNAGDAHDGQPHIAVSLERLEDSGAVLVRDSGCGIPEALRERVFEPFYTTKTSGTGLGLAIARQLLDLHGGEIDIASTSPQGTTMRVRLPRSREGGALT